MFELLFLLCFTLHNMEEALWLPAWSQNVGKAFHTPVEANEFRFAVLVVTIFGYLLTFAALVLGGSLPIIHYAYLGFVLAMMVNAVMPHLAATMLTRRYAPGTLTAILLNLPVGLYLVLVVHGKNQDYLLLFLGFAVMGSLMLIGLRPLFRLGRKLFPPEN